MSNDKKPVLLVIFDGWGIGKKYPGNAIELAKKPFFDSLWQDYPHSTLQASGEAVGLPAGQIGSSEIGHGIIGAGSVIDTDMVRISKAIKNGELKDNEALNKLFDHAKKNSSYLHVLGQISPGGVHSHMDHIFGILRAAKDAGVEKIAIHVFTDGRDVSPKSGSVFVKQLEDLLKELGIGFISTLSGRYYAMDRDNNWDRVQKTENAIFEGVGREKGSASASEVMQTLYNEGEEDEFILPLVFTDKAEQKHSIAKHDGVIFCNFRADRARELSKLINEKVEKEDLCFVTLTEYDKRLNALVAFPPFEIKTCLADQLAKAKLTQVHIAETEKYAHLTYFLNGGNEHPYPNEDRILIDSRKDVATHDKAPEMRVKEIVNAAIACIKGDPQFVYKEGPGENEQTGVKPHDVVIINIANPDMVGHTGNLEATIKAIEIVDIHLKRLIETILEVGGVAFVTADHGNAEQMIDFETGEKFTAHTTNPVPGILTDKTFTLRAEGGLADVTPTILEILDLDQPVEMTGKSLIEHP